MSHQAFYELTAKLLCPPGNGVHTVSNGGDKKAALQKALYGDTTPKKVDSAWKKHLQELEQSNLPCLLGVSSDNGGGILRGANWGPLFIRNQLLQTKKLAKIFDCGDVRVIPHLLVDDMLNNQQIKKCQLALYQDSNSQLPVSPLSVTQTFCEAFYREFPYKKLFGLGGDHSVSYPLVMEYLKAKKNQGKKVAVIHFDAHTDLLESRLGVDICFGSWAFHILPFLDSPDLLIQLGIRATKKNQEHWEKEYGVKQYWAQEFKQRSAESIATEICETLKKKNISELYISFDIDAIDARYASATGTPEENGLELHDSIKVIRSICEKFQLTGCDLVEVAPYIKHQAGGNQQEPDSTLMVAESVASTLLEFMS